MNEPEIKTAVKEYILQNLLITRGVELSDHTSFLDRGILDSTSVLELVAFLEETFHISVDDTDIVPENLDSLCAISEFVGRKQSPLQGIVR